MATTYVLFIDPMWMGEVVFDKPLYYSSFVRSVKK